MRHFSRNHQFPTNAVAIGILSINFVLTPTLTPALCKLGLDQNVAVLGGLKRTIYLLTKACIGSTVITSTDTSSSSGSAK